jgi:thiopurine S-methyltransferase
MDPAFWHARWQQGQIGFHQAEVNPYLLQHSAALGPARGLRVLVPLCGKTLDLAWLAEQGHEVVGVELSPLAVEAFFADRGVAPVTQQAGPFISYRGVGIEILCGDVFALDAERAGPLSAVFDRAALVALPSPLRERYVQLIADLLPAGARLLLVTFEYEPAEIAGPPFSVTEATVRALYEPHFEITRLARHDSLGAEPQLRARGMTSLHEGVYAMVRR